MKIRILKRLREEAKMAYYLLPIDGNKNNCMIVGNIWCPCTRSFESRYYFRAIDPSCRLSDVVTKTVQSSDVKYCVNYQEGSRPAVIKWNCWKDEKGHSIVVQGGFPLEEAVEILREKRREFILKRLNEERTKAYASREKLETYKLNKLY